MSEHKQKRYALSEAASMVVTGDAKDARYLLKRMKQAVLAGDLTAHRPGSILPVNYPEGSVVGEEDPVTEADNTRLRPSDLSHYAGGITWVDEEYDERLGAVLAPRQHVPDDLEAYRDDLNQWLKNSRIPFSFPDADAAHLVPAGASGAPETTEQRQDRRLHACEAAGLNFRNYKGRLPDGVGKVADCEGLSRQAFSDDIKAALKRRKSAEKEDQIIRF